MSLHKSSISTASLLRPLLADLRRAALAGDPLSKAAQELGSRPKLLLKARRKVKRVWTGFVQGERTWRGRVVVLPNRQLAEIIQVSRGSAVVLLNQVDGNGNRIMQACPASSLSLYKLPSAIRLGRLKRGVTEPKSLAKAESSRRNGSKPVRPGSRPRGRPQGSRRNLQATSW